MVDASPTASQPAKTPRKHGRGRRILKWLGGAGLVAAGAFWFFYIRDEPPPDDADLMAQDAPVPDEQNGYVQLSKMDLKKIDVVEFAKTQGLDEGEAEDILLGDKSNDAFARKFLAQLQPSFAELERCLSLPYFIFPERDNRPGAKISDLSIELELTHGLDLQERIQQKEGNYSGATHSTGVMRQLTLHEAEEQGNLIRMLTSYGCDGIATHAAVRLLNDSNLPSPERDTLTEMFAPSRAWDVSVEKGIPVEYRIFHFMATQFKTEDVPVLFNNSTVKPFPVSITYMIMHAIRENKTQRAAAELYREASQATHQPYAILHTQNEQAGSNAFDVGFLDFLRPNLGALIIQRLIRPSMYSVIESSYYAKTADSLLQIGFALRHYFDDHGLLPTTLKELVPQYLAAIPADPFDGQPLRYDAAKGIVYSVGKSLKDSDGSSQLRFTKDYPQYGNPLGDDEQPTLVLEFQKAGQTAR